MLRVTLQPSGVYFVVSGEVLTRSDLRPTLQMTIMEGCGVATLLLFLKIANGKMLSKELIPVDFHGKCR